MDQKEHMNLKCILWKRTDSKQTMRVMLFYTFVLLAIFFVGLSL